MKIKQIVLITILLSNILCASHKMTIQELVALASTYVKTPVILDRNIDNTIYIYTQVKLNKNTINSVLTKVLKNNGLRLSFYDTYYMISVINTEESLDRIIKINYLDKEQIKNIFEYFKQDYIYIDNSIMFTSLKNQYLKIKNKIKIFDTPKKQKKMRITVLETNINKLREFGMNYNLSDISSNLFNVSVGNIIGSYSNKQTKNFGLDIKAMARDGITKIVTNPILTIRDKELTKFNITRTIPTVTSTQSIIDGKNEIVENLVYKSFGIKIDVKPIINGINNDLELNINLQDILSNVDNKPETSDKVLEQKVIIKDNSTYLLSGFKKTLKVSSDNGVPILKDIPMLGYFFKWQSKEDIEIILQIIIEIVDENMKL